MAGMNNTMLNIAIRQLRVLPLCGGEPLAREQVLAILSELGALGYRVSNPARLAHAGIDTLALHRQSMQVLAAMRGADKAWVPLFAGFPDDVPVEPARFGGGECSCVPSSSKLPESISRTIAGCWTVLMTCISRRKASGSVALRSSIAPSSASCCRNPAFATRSWNAGR